MKNIILILVLCLSKLMFSQSLNIDSIRTIVKTAKEDTSLINNYLYLGKEFKSKNLDSSLYYFSKCINLCVKLNDEINKGYALMGVGTYYALKNNIDSALTFHNQVKYISLKNISKAKDKTSHHKAKKLLADYYGSVASLNWFQLYNSELAIAYFDSSQQVAKEIQYLKTILVNYNTIGNIYRSMGDQEMALINYNEGLKLASKINDKFNQSLILGNIGLSYSSIANFQKALYFYNDALKIDEKLNNKSGIMRHLGNISNIYRKQGDYTKALEYALRSLKIAETLGNKKSEISILGNIGIIYDLQSDHEKAKYYYLKALKLGELIKDKIAIGNQYSNLGIVYMQIGGKEKDKKNFSAALYNYNIALDYYNKAAKINEETLDLEGLAANYGNIGTNYKEQGNIKKSLEYEIKCYKIFEKTGDLKGISAAAGNIANTYTELNNYPEAEKYLKKSLSIATQIGSLNEIKFAHEFLYRLYKKTGKVSQCLFHYEKYIQIRDSIFNEENTKASIKLELKYDYEKKASADSVKVAEEKKLTTFQLKQEENQRYFLYSGLGLTLIFGGVMYNRFRITKKQKAIIESQKKIVEEQKQAVDEKQKEILDSIRYAKRIQTSLLPNENYFKKHIPKG